MSKPKKTEDIISDSIIQIQELVEYQKTLERKLPFSKYVFSIFFDCKEGDMSELEERRQYLTNTLPNLKKGKGKWKVIKEALEGLDTLTALSQDSIKKHILKRPLEEAVEESRTKVRKIEKELGKTDNLNDLPESKNTMTR